LLRDLRRFRTTTMKNFILLRCDWWCIKTHNCPLFLFAPA